MSNNYGPCFNRIKFFDTSYIFLVDISSSWNYQESGSYGDQIL